MFQSSKQRIDSRSAALADYASRQPRDDEWEEPQPVLRSPSAAEIEARERDERYNDLIARIRERAKAEEEEDRRSRMIGRGRPWADDDKPADVRREQDSPKMRKLAQAATLAEIDIEALKPQLSAAEADFIVWKNTPIRTESDRRQLERAANRYAAVMKRYLKAKNAIDEYHEAQDELFCG